MVNVLINVTYNGFWLLVLDTALSFWDAATLVWRRVASRVLLKVRVWAVRDASSSNDSRRRVSAFSSVSRLWIESPSLPPSSKFMGTGLVGSLRAGLSAYDTAPEDEGSEGLAILVNLRVGTRLGCGSCDGPGCSTDGGCCLHDLGNLKKIY